MPINIELEEEERKTAKWKWNASFLLAISETQYPNDRLILLFFWKSLFFFAIEEGKIFF